MDGNTSRMVDAWSIAEQPCDSNPCQNSGSCVPDIPRDSFRCLCLPGFTGVHCHSVLSAGSARASTIVQSISADCAVKPTKT